jgi:hypothetical protein
MRDFATEQSVPAQDERKLNVSCPFVKGSGRRAPRPYPRVLA